MSEADLRPLDLARVGVAAELPGELRALREAVAPSGWPFEISPPEGLTTQRPP